MINIIHNKIILEKRRKRGFVLKIGEKLKQGRMDNNLTQEDVSKILNVSRSTVSSWEVNRTYPDLEILVTLSDLYEISLDNMLREDNQMVKTMAKELKKSSKRKRINIALLIILIPVLLLTGYQLWTSRLIIKKHQIIDYQVEINGEEINSNSTVRVSLQPDKFYEYSGYWADTGKNNEINIQFYQHFNPAADSPAVTIPVKIDNLVENRIVGEIIIKGSNPFNSKKIFDSFIHDATQY